MGDYNALLDTIRKRNSRTGIVTADRYFREMEGCFDGGVCPLRVGDGSEDQWRKALKEAESKLTFTNSDMQILRTRRKGRKSSDGAIMVFDCIMTTPQRDRDGDVILTKGVKVDPDMPLLWQHMSMHPIGKLLKVVKHTSEELVGRFSIVGTALGRDVAKLMKAGVLRMSHGFEPLDYEAMDDEEGWLFKEISTYEASLVSLPSNIGARVVQIVSSKSRWADDFQTDLVRGWVKSFTGSKTQVSVPVEVHECECQKKQHEFAESGNVDDGSIALTEPQAEPEVVNEPVVKSFPDIEREYFAALAMKDTDALRRAHRHVSLMRAAAEEREQARENEKLLELFR